MKHVLYIFAALLFAVSAVPAFAFDGSITGGMEFLGGNKDNAKANEYRYDRQGPLGGFVDADYRSMPEDGNTLTTVGFGYRSQEDIRLDFGRQVFGDYRMRLKYRRFGHVYATGVKSVYTGAGTGTLTIPAGLRTLMGTAPPSLTAASLQMAYDAAPAIDIQTVRDRVGAEFRLDKLRPFTIEAGLDYEHREGDKPYSGTFAQMFVSPTSLAAELPEPVKYDTYNARLGLELALKSIYVNVRFNHSTFENSIKSLSFENIVQTAGVPAFGRNSLPPSNSMDSAGITIAKNLPYNSRLTIDFTHSWLSQDDALLQATTIAGSPANPRNRADASVRTMNFLTNFNIRPTNRLELTATGRYYSHTNDTKTDDFPFIPVDDPALASAPTQTTDYYGWRSGSGSLEATYEIADRSHVGASYEFKRDTYLTVANLANSSTYNTYKLFYDNRKLDWLTTRVTIQYQDKVSEYPDGPPAAALLDEIGMIKRYFAASKKVYKADLLTTISPTDSLDFTFQYLFNMDDYDHSLFGLLNSLSHTGTLDVSYQPTKAVVLNAYYSYEYGKWKQGAEAAAAGPPPPPTDWVMTNTNQTHTVGAGAHIKATERLGVDLDAQYSLILGRSGFNAAAGAQPFQNYDSSNLLRLTTKFNYRLTKAIDLLLGYTYERWDTKDYQLDGVANVITISTSTAINLSTMNSLFRPYGTHLGWIGLKYKF